MRYKSPSTLIMILELQLLAFKLQGELILTVR